MAVLGLSLVVGAALPAGASTKPAPDSSQEAFREKKPTSTTDSTSAPGRAPRASKPTTSSTTPPSTVKVEPSSTTSTTKAAPANLHSPTQVDAPARRTPSLPTPPGVVTSGPASADATSKTTETTSGARNPHVVENDNGKVPLPAFGEVAPTTTSTEVSNAVVGNIGQGTGPKPSQAPRRRQPARALGATGASTRPLLMLAGSTLLLGAMAIAFGEPGEAQAARAAAGQATGTLPGRRRRPARRTPARRTPPGWESGVPLAPERREQARQRMQGRQNRPRVSRPGDAPGA